MKAETIHKVVYISNDGKRRFDTAEECAFYDFGDAAVAHIHIFRESWSGCGWYEDDFSEDAYDACQFLVLDSRAAAEALRDITDMLALECPFDSYRLENYTEDDFPLAYCFNEEAGWIPWEEEKDRMTERIRIFSSMANGTFKDTAEKE